MYLRVILERDGAREPNSAQRKNNENYVRESLSHIMDKIRIQSIWTEYHQIMIDYNHSSGAVGINFKTLIEDAIKRRTDLRIISIEVPGKIIEAQGLEMLMQTENFTQYRVHPLFFKQLANDEQCRRTIATKKVLNISYELEEADNVKGAYISIIPSVTFAPGLLTMANAYNKLAQKLCQDEELTNKLCLDDCFGLDIIINNNGNIDTVPHMKSLEETPELTHKMH